MSRSLHWWSRTLTMCCILAATVSATLTAPAAAAKGRQPYTANVPTTGHTQPLHNVWTGAPAVAQTHAVKRTSATGGKTVGPRVVATATCPSATVSLQILVIAADGSEADLPAIQNALDYLGTPYTVYVAAQTPGGLTAGKLGTGCVGNYAGVILTTSNLAYFNGTDWASALSPDEWTNLATYEANLGVREISWYTYPTADFGFQSPTGAVDTSATPLATKLTTAGKSFFTYVNPNSSIAIQYAYTYQAHALTDGSTATLLTDAQGDALAVVHTGADGRQVLALTYDSNPNLLHEIVLSYGYVNWVTGGVFIGDRRVYMSSQIDDQFIPDDEWLPSTPCGTPTDQTGAEYRDTSADMQALVTWEKNESNLSFTGNIRLALAFNGSGTSSTDPLTTYLSSNSSKFFWIDHTYDHLNLDAATYSQTRSQITQNNKVQSTYKLTPYAKSNLVTPDISGLTNSNAMQAAYDTGVRYVVTDTSIAGYNNPFPNNGIYNQYVPGILMIPRHPVNLFYNVTTPDEWVAEYNCLYLSYWGRNLSYSEILDFESNQLLTYMLRGEMDPWMFHIANLRAYDGTHSLLGDLLDLTLAKYRTYYKLGVQYITMNALGQKMANRMQYLGAGVTATIIPGQSITITALKAATVPVTGLNSANADFYGGQNITYVTLTAGQSITYPLT